MTLTLTPADLAGTSLYKPTPPPVDMTPRPWDFEEPIQKAIAAALEAGGDVVWLAPGRGPVIERNGRSWAWA